MALPDKGVQRDPGVRSKPVARDQGVRNDPNAARGEDARPRMTVLTPEQASRRRRRNIAIGLTVGFLALLFYVVTIVKLGPGVLNRPM